MTSNHAAVAQAVEPHAGLRPRSPLQKSLRDEYVEVFRAMSEPLRVEIISLFADDQCACTRLEEKLPISKSTISYHIKILNQAGLVDVNKRGRFYHYTLRRQIFDYFLPGFLERLNHSEVATHEADDLYDRNSA